MTTRDLKYYNFLHKVKEGQEAICLCANCCEPLYYEDTAYKFESETLCEDCFKTLADETFKFKLGDKDIPSPDYWDEDDY